jgi:hypothetical protein
MDLASSTMRRCCQTGKCWLPADRRVSKARTKNRPTSLHFGNVGSGNWHLADHGQLHLISRLSLHRAPVVGRPRFIRRRQREKDRRNIFAALSVQWRTSNYLFGADRSWLRTIIFRRHSGRDKYYKRDDDCALLSNTQLQHEPAYHSPLFLAR